MDFSCLQQCDRIPYTERRYEHPGRVMAVKYQNTSPNAPPNTSRNAPQTTDNKMFYAIMVLIFLVYLKTKTN